MKGILLAGGRGTRLYPATRVISKHLLPVHDKPMIFYSLTTLLLGDIRDIALISTPDDLPAYRRLLGDGSAFGIRLTYLEQPQAGGIAQSMIIAQDFIGADPVTLTLGDNIFFGEGFGRQVRAATARPHSEKGATVFAYQVVRPNDFGVIELGPDGPISIEEKPAIPKSNYAVTGLYVYDNDVVALARGLRPSPRGELEITDLNNAYLARGDLRVTRLGRGIAWLDTGTHRALQSASEFVAAVQERQGMRIACLEEVAYRRGLIDRDRLQASATAYAGTDYGAYLQHLCDAERIDSASSEAWRAGSNN